MTRENIATFKTNELTDKLNQYKKDGLLTKKERRDLRKMEKQFFGNDLEADINIKSNIIERADRRQSLKNKANKKNINSINKNILNDISSDNSPFSYKKNKFE